MDFNSQRLIAFLQESALLRNVRSLLFNAAVINGDGKEMIMRTVSMF